MYFIETESSTKKFELLNDAWGSLIPWNNQKK